MRFSYENWGKFKEGGGRSSYFSIKSGEMVIGRFVYTDFNDMEKFSVHEFRNPTGAVTTISCAKPTSDSPMESCKWCSMGNQAVSRVVLPIYVEDKQEIQYWTRTTSFVEQNLIPEFEEVLNTGKPIVSQKFKIIRTGEGLQTKYTVTRTGVPDTTTKDMLGEVKDPFDMGMIKESDYDYDPNAQSIPQQNQQTGYQQNYNQPQQGYGQPQQGYQQGYGQPQATGRRTLDTF